MPTMFATAPEGSVKTDCCPMWDDTPKTISVLGDVKYQEFERVCRLLAFGAIINSIAYSRKHWWPVSGMSCCMCFNRGADAYLTHDATSTCEGSSWRRIHGARQFRISIAVRWSFLCVLVFLGKALLRVQVGECTVGLASNPSFGSRRPAFKSFTLSDYGRMRDDTPRTEAFYQAIDVLAPGKLVLDLGTGSLALLAIRCARAGALHVYAVEASQVAAAAARVAVTAAELEDQITVIEACSQNLVLPRPVDLVVHEILGEIASREGVVASLRDASERHVNSTALQKGGWSVPKAASTWITPVTWPPASYLEDFRRKTGSILLPPSSNSGFMRFPALQVSECALSDAQPLEEIHFDALFQSAGDAGFALQQSRRLRFRMTRAGKLAGLALHITVDCGGGAPIVSSAEADSHWANTFVMATESDVDVGDTLEVDADVDLGPEVPAYRLTARLQRQGSSLTLDVVPERMFQ
mmetsp:Transcript_63053/g.124674  ORF Transcript_63053/g.124674 Transcript_63053/m.124674 type:complete len:468 (-) Transcript_63053:66-1469(-)